MTDNTPGNIRPTLWNRNYTKVWTANFMIFFSFYLLTPLLPLYLRDTFHAGKDMTGLVLSGYTFTALLTRPFGGFLVDSFPRQKVLLVSFLLFALFFAGYFISWSLLLFALVRTLHGAPFGATTVANSTVAIDVLHPERRAEGIGYYGLSNNIATAIGPSAGYFLYTHTHNFDLLFALSLLTALGGVAIVASLRPEARPAAPQAPQRLSLDRFFLLKGWSEGVAMTLLSFGYGVISTYLAIYSRDVMHLSGGTGTFFALLALGLIASRLVGGRSLRRGRVVENAQWGMALSLVGYLLFVARPDAWGYYGAALIIGLGNGHMFPAMQTMFINLVHHNRRGTANSTQLVTWDVGMGLGIIVGGLLAEHFGYASAFWAAFGVNACGVLFFWTYVRRDYARNRLR